MWTTATYVLLRLIDAELISSSTAVADALIVIYCGTALVPYLIIALLDNDNKS